MNPSRDMDWPELIILLCGLAVAAAVYFLPWIVARGRAHPNSLAIFMLNLFLGWTFLGWVIALVWACTSRPPEKA